MPAWLSDSCNIRTFYSVEPAAQHRSTEALHHPCSRERDTDSDYQQAEDILQDAKYHRHHHLLPHDQYNHLCRDREEDHSPHSERHDTYEYLCYPDYRSCRYKQRCGHPTSRPNHLYDPDFPNTSGHHHIVDSTSCHLPYHSNW